MIKKILKLSVFGLLLFPLMAFAQEKLAPPNLVEVKINGQFADKGKISLSQDQTMELSGTALAGSQVYLYISTSGEPLVAISDVDKNGYWFFRLNQALSVDKHQIEAETHQGEEISAKVTLLQFNITPSSENPLVRLSTTNLIIFSILGLLVVVGIVWFFVRRSK